MNVIEFLIEYLYIGVREFYENYKQGVCLNFYYLVWEVFFLGMKCLILEIFKFSVKSLRQLKFQYQYFQVKNEYGIEREKMVLKLILVRKFCWM